MASSEQRPQPTAEAPESISEVTPPFGLGGDGAGTEGEERPTTPPFGFGELDDFVAESANGDSEPLPGVSEPLEETADIAEPEAGQRYIVTLSQKTATFPRERCAHCLRRPAPRNLLVGQAASSDPPYEVPLCESCHEQASMRTEEQQTSRLVAHLSSVLIAGLLIVGAMVVGLIDVREIGVLDLLLIATLALVGYGLPAVLLLGRTSQLPPSEDAKFVRSTLRIRQNDGIAFGWRNRGYAELFSADNEEILLGELARALED